ncbi:hypothetical protein C4559_04410 [Candidatus Microgenomates bacterium]|nr:MAG: hypothetical protein C4559_04410 [Candidatus Microgenomates bacterium]
MVVIEAHGKLRGTVHRLFQKPELSSKEQAAEILKENSQFFWHTPGETRWGGLNQKELLRMTGEISKFIGIDPGEAKKIRVFFADNMPIFIGKKNYQATAVCENRDGRYNEFRVVLNRSQEIAQGLAITRLKQFKKMEQAQLPKNPECLFEDPKELITWLITEELDHAHFGLKAGSAEKEQQIQKRYKQWLQKQGFQPDAENEYTFRLDELIASRVAVRALAFFAKSSERVNYFRNIYQESLKTGRPIIPVVTKNIGSQTYINTF